jgi:hypothetical protein
MKEIYSADKKAESDFREGLFGSQITNLFFRFDICTNMFAGARYGAQSKLSRKGKQRNDSHDRENDQKQYPYSEIPTMNSNKTPLTFGRLKIRM